MVDVVIPVYKPGDDLLRLLRKLDEQSVKPKNIILINTEEQFFDTEKYMFLPNVQVQHISKKEFDHGGTRHMGMELSDAEYVLFMTMDAIPVDDKLIERLLHGFDSVGPKGEIPAVCYGRQLSDGKCRLQEQNLRLSNYPEHSMIKTKADVPNMGIKAYFCSDVCAMYDRKIYYDNGGFEKKTIFNEDMIYAAKAINNNYAVVYCADAGVWHAHDFTNKQQLRRSFDMGVSQAEHPEIFENVSSEQAGVKYVISTMKFLLKKGHWYEVPHLIISCIYRYVGYRNGRRYKKLSRRKILRMTSNPDYWI